MIVVAVVGDPGGGGLPSFMDSIRKGRRAEAVAALAQVQQAQERWRANKLQLCRFTDAATGKPPGLGMVSASTTARACTR